MRFSSARGLLDRGRIGPFLRLMQPLVILDRKFGVDRQPARLVAARQADRVLDALPGSGSRRDVRLVLVRRQHLFQQRPELHLAEAAAGLHVGQHPFQVADAGGERLHLAEPLVHLLEPLRHQPERLAEPCLQGALQFLLDRRPHLVELGLVALLQRQELRLQRIAHLGEVAADAVAHVGELLLHQRGEVLQLLRAFLPVGACRASGGLVDSGHLLAEAQQLLALHAGHAGHLLSQARLHLGQPRARFHAHLGGRVLDRGAHFAFEPFVVLRQRRQARVEHGRAVAAHGHDQRDQGQQQGRTEDDGQEDRQRFVHPADFTGDRGRVPGPASALSRWSRRPSPRARCP